jgi:hypothetical protein
MSLLQTQAARRALAVAGVVLVTGCPQKVAMWIAPGSSSQNLVFLLGSERGRPSDVAEWRISVWACSDSTPNRLGRMMWEANVFGADRAALVHSVRYGEAPRGFKTVISAQPLVPGCYVAAVGQAIRFFVQPDGSIADRGPAWSRSQRGAEVVHLDRAG